MINNKRQKFEEVDYKKTLKIYYVPYRELEFKYKSLEETNVGSGRKIKVNFWEE